MIKFAVPSGLLACITVVVTTSLISACSDNPAAVEGFVLPEGDVQRGQEVFASVGCRDCHTVANLTLPPLDQTPELNIVLGGNVVRIKSYGELLNSVVNPNHEVAVSYLRKLEPDARKNAKSAMTDFNSVLTVTQLIDLTTFLHSRYELLGSEYRGYRYVR